MAAEVLKSFGTLQLELEQAKTSLKDVDEHIKKLIGRDPSENQRSVQKRPGNHLEEPRGRTRINNFQNNRNKPTFENDEPVGKKRNLDSSVFKRLDRPKHFEEDLSESLGKNQLISKVIVTPKELPSRQEVLAAQGADEKSKARNRRMFGALLGTLQKFRQEETKLKSKEEKRAQVEKKLEEQQIKEREELKRERADLFWSRKRKQAEIRMIELKMTRMQEHAAWEDKHKPLAHFIQTKTKPHIYYLPKILNDNTKHLLEQNTQSIEKMIDQKRQDMYEELTTIEQRMKRNFTKGQDQEQEPDQEQEQENDPDQDHDAPPAPDPEQESNPEHQIQQQPQPEPEVELEPETVKEPETTSVQEMKLKLKPEPVEQQDVKTETQEMEVDIGGGAPKIEHIDAHTHS